MSKKTEKKKKNKEDISRKKDTSKNSKKNKQDSPTIEELLAIEKDKNLRLFAEFENFRKRTAREKLDLFSTANKDIMSILLPILDNFESVSNHIDHSISEFRDGTMPSPGSLSPEPSQRDSILEILNCWVSMGKKNN